MEHFTFQPRLAWLLLRMISMKIKTITLIGLGLLALTAPVGAAEGGVAVRSEVTVAVDIREAVRAFQEARGEVLNTQRELARSMATTAREEMAAARQEMSVVRQNLRDSLQAIREQAREQSARIEAEARVEARRGGRD